MNLFKIEVKKNFKGSIIWGIVLFGILFLYLAFYPSMKDSGFSELLDGKLNMMPKGLLDSLGLDQLPDFSIFMEYYSYVFQFVVIGMCVYAMILGTKALSKEEGDKTIEFLYAKPVTRSKIIFSKMLASMVSLLTVMGMVICASIIGDIIFAGGKDIVMILIVDLMMIIPTLVYWSVGYAISSFLKDDNKSIVTSLGIFFGTYLLGIIANTINSLDFLKYLSPVNYNPAADVFKYFAGRVGSSLNMGAIILSIIIFILGITTTYIKYNKKDLLN